VVYDIVVKARELRRRAELCPPRVCRRVGCEVAVAGILSGKRGEIATFRRAIDDIGSPPPCGERPDDVGRTSTGYRRDDAVRQFVLGQANGKCEYVERWDLSCRMGAVT
jgi:hypothetical protein